MARKRIKEETFVSKWTVMSAFIMLLVTITALTTATYAWFTSNTTVDLGDLDVSVQASSGIQVSMDALTWKAGLTTADIKGGMYTVDGNRFDKNQIPKTLSAVSTGGTLSNGRMLFYKGEVTTNQDDNSFILGSVATVETQGARPYTEAGDAGDFITFDMFIQTATATTLSLTAASDVTNTNGNSGLQNAARVAFIKMQNAATPEAAKENETVVTTKIWEPNASSHTQEGINNALSPYGFTVVNDATTKSVAAAAPNSIRPSYYGLNDEFTGATLNTTSSDYVKLVDNNVLLQTVTEQEANTTLFDISAGITKIRVYCWIEGQDVDCEDKVSGTSIKFDIALTKPLTPATPTN